MSSAGASATRQAVVTIAMLAAPIAASSVAATGATSASSLAAGAAGTATITASASIVCSSIVGPWTTRQPSPAGSSRRTARPVTTDPPAASIAAATLAGNEPMPPVTVAKTGSVEGTDGTTRRAAARTERSSRGSCGIVAARDSSSARPAYTPPSRGSTSRSTTARPTRCATHLPTETSSPGGAPGRIRSAATRATSAAVRTPCSAPALLGTPMTVPVGIGRNAPRAHTPAVEVRGETSSSDRPSEATRSSASGTRRRNISAPSSTGTPATSEIRSFPPTRSVDSTTETSTPSIASTRAAASPAMPPPTTTTRVIRSPSPRAPGRRSARGCPDRCPGAPRARG